MLAWFLVLSLHVYVFHWRYQKGVLDFRWFSHIWISTFHWLRVRFVAHIKIRWRVVERLNDPFCFRNIWSKACTHNWVPSALPRRYKTVTIASQLAWRNNNGPNFVGQTTAVLRTKDRHDVLAVLRAVNGHYFAGIPNFQGPILAPFKTCFVPLSTGDGTRIAVRSVSENLRKRHLLHT